MDILIIQILNSIFYACILFLIAGRTQPHLRRHANREPGAWQPLCARRLCHCVGHRHVCRGAPLWVLFILLPSGAIAVALVGALIEPTLLRPLYNRPEEYQLLITFALLLIIEDVMHFLFGGVPLTAGAVIDSMGTMRVMNLRYPVYNLLVIVHRRRGRRLPLGGYLSHAIRCHPQGHVAEHAHGFGTRLEREVGVRAGIRARLLYGGPRRRGRRTGAGRRARHGRRSADPCIRRGRHRRARQP